MARRNLYISPGNFTRNSKKDLIAKNSSKLFGRSEKSRSFVEYLHREKKNCKSEKKSQIKKTQKTNEKKIEHKIEKNQRHMIDPIIH